MEKQGGFILHGQSPKQSRQKDNVSSEYFMMRSAHLHFCDVHLKGRYSFQYIAEAKGKIIIQKEIAPKDALKWAFFGTFWCLKLYEKLIDILCYPNKTYIVKAYNLHIFI